MAGRGPVVGATGENQEKMYPVCEHGRVRGDSCIGRAHIGFQRTQERGPPRTCWVWSAVGRPRVSVDSMLDSGSGQASRSGGSSGMPGRRCGRLSPAWRRGLFSRLPLQGARRDTSAPTLPPFLCSVHERVGKAEPKGAWQVSVYLLRTMQVWLAASECVSVYVFTRVPVLRAELCTLSRE